MTPEPPLKAGLPKSSKLVMSALVRQKAVTASSNKKADAWEKQVRKLKKGK